MAKSWLFNYTLSRFSVSWRVRLLADLLHYIVCAVYVLSAFGLLSNYFLKKVIPYLRPWCSDVFCILRPNPRFPYPNRVGHQLKCQQFKKAVKADIFLTALRQSQNTWKNEKLYCASNTVGIYEGCGAYVWAPRLCQRVFFWSHSRGNRIYSRISSKRFSYDNYRHFLSYHFFNRLSREGIMM